jgi:hypothetical protein
MFYTIWPIFKQFLNSVTIEQFMLLTEPQLNCSFDFTVCCVVMSSKMYFQMGKETIIRPRQVGAIRRGVIPDDEIRISKVYSCYRSGVQSNVVLWKGKPLHIRAMRLLVLSVRNSDC